jgi:hypothetical protein
MWAEIPGVVCSAMASQTRSTSASDTPWPRRELACGIGPVHLEAHATVPKPLGEADIVEHRRRVEQLGSKVSPLRAPASAPHK